MVRGSRFTAFLKVVPDRFHKPQYCKVLECVYSVPTIRSKISTHKLSTQVSAVVVVTKVLMQFEAVRLDGISLCYLYKYQTN